MNDSAKISLIIGGIIFVFALIGGGIGPLFDLIFALIGACFWPVVVIVVIIAVVSALSKKKK
jgi:hypothetical protein